MNPARAAFAQCMGLLISAAAFVLYWATGAVFFKAFGVAMFVLWVVAVCIDSWLNRP